MLYTDTMLTKRQKENAMKPVKRHDSDTGSPEAQVAVLTRRINELTEHLNRNKKDKHSRKGLLKLVAKRRAHLKYLQRKDLKKYKALLKELNLKK